MLGQDGKAVIINHAGYVVRVHVSRVVEVHHEYDMNANIENSKKNLIQEIKDRSSNV